MSTTEALRELLEMLKDPVAVHLAMLRGEIAKPALRDMLHAYGGEALAQYDRGAVATSAPAEPRQYSCDGCAEVIARGACPHCALATSAPSEPALSAYDEELHRSGEYMMPRALHPETARLVQRFAFHLAIKLRKAERKYGYSDGWRDDKWEADCQKALAEHVAKGDPLDVAAYCAFCMHHGWSTAAPHPPAASQEPSREQLIAHEHEWLGEKLNAVDVAPDVPAVTLAGIARPGSPAVTLSTWAQSVPNGEPAKLRWDGEEPEAKDVGGLQINGPAADPIAEYHRGWNDAVQAHKLPYGAEVRQDHDWRPREVQERHGQVTLPLAEYQRLVADAQPASQEQEEPVAYLYQCSKPGKRMEYASVDASDTNHWPVDQWVSIVKTPLYAHPPTDTSAVQVCPERDIECGMRPASWCANCPLRKADTSSARAEPSGGLRGIYQALYAASSFVGDLSRAKPYMNEVRGGEWLCINYPGAGGAERARKALRVLEELAAQPASAAEGVATPQPPDDDSDEAAVAAWQSVRREAYAIRREGATVGDLLKAVHDYAQVAATTQPARELSDEEIDDIVTAGSYRNAAGGIYATRVHDFARAAIAASREPKAS